jgi:hypothetical protein
LPKYKKSPLLREAFEYEFPRWRVGTRERYNYLSRIDGWMNIGYSGSLELLVKRYVKYLEKESFCELC